MKLRLLLIVLGASMLVLSMSNREADAAPTADTAAQCKSIADRDLAQVQDAPTQIIEVKLVSNRGDVPEYCQVMGYVAPQVGFILRLPTGVDWNGKLVELGCGGYCGDIDYFIGACDHILRRGYACAATDNGHKSTVYTSLWGYNNLQADVEHAFLGSHVTVLAAKAIVQMYYAEKPKKSYFLGCSTGGRQAMMEAQRFPWDFDGIIAGSPSLGVPQLHMSELWGNRAFTEATGDPILGPDALRFLHDAVVTKCDMNDGVRDGIIGDPRMCSFDPTELLCSASQETECLTQKQVDAVRKIYNGPATSDGHPIYPGGVAKGSELSWMNNLRGPDSNPRYIYNFVREEFRYSGFQPNAGPSWKPEYFDFDRDYKRLGVAEGLYDATNPDLRRFKAAGGKLISYAGWNDVVGMAAATVDYYETVEKTMGGRANTQEFFRLFVIPGMNHCTGGEGAFGVDYLGYLEAWVEKGVAPAKLLAYHLTADIVSSDEFGARLDVPPAAKSFSFSRPVYPYPTIAKYLGQGNPDEAKNFGPIEPQ